MRRHAKASTAGSTQRLGKSKPALLACVLAATVAALALVVGSASGATTRFLVEVFGSSATPTFPEDRGMAVDQATGELYVLEISTGEIRRYSANGTPSNFSALGINVIDGEGAGDGIPEGSLAFPASPTESQIAIDESGTATDGNIYVTESSRDQVSIFSSTGAYLGELSAHSGGAFNEPLGVAVDPPGNVYVGDFSESDLIHKYDPAANPPVNADNVASFGSLAGESSIGTLAAGAGATAGFIFVNRLNGELFKLDSTSGELKYQLATSASTVSVDPTTGHVFAPRLTGSESEVVEYDASGAVAATKVSAFKPGSTAEGVAVKGSTEEVYVSRAGTENVEVFGPAAVIPDVVTEAPSSNTGIRATLAGTVNPDGVELDECFFEWGSTTAYGNVAPCAETPAAIGSGTSPVAVHADINGLAPQGTTYNYRLLAANPNGSVNGANQSFTTADTVAAEAASGITSTAATLNGTVNPDGASLTGCVFEWGPPKTPGEAFQKYPNTAPCVPGPGGIGSGTSPVAVSAAIGGLEIGSTYVYRLKATYPTGPVVNPAGAPLSLQTAGPGVAGAWAENVVRTEATLKARINPAGQATTYRFEYGTTEAYGQQTPELNVGSDSSLHEVTQFLEGLTPGTTYHYRLIATNGIAENIGSDQTFTTYVPFAPQTSCPNQANRYGPSANLPDCRAYEMVSPVEKNGADIVTQIFLAGDLTLGIDQAALDGDKMAYSSWKAFGDAKSNLYTNTYIATRTAAGWSSHSINPPHEDNRLPFVDSNFPGRFAAFSEDLSTGFLLDNARPPLNDDALPDANNYYLRDNLTDTYTALTTQLLSGNRSLGESISGAPPSLQGRSADGTHLLFPAGAQLTADARPGNNLQLYDYHDGELELVSVLPNGEASPDENMAGQSRVVANNHLETGNFKNAISADGSRIFWKAMGFALSGPDGVGKLYVRIDGETTVAVSESVSSDYDAVYHAASADGSQVIFSAGPIIGGLGSEPLGSELKALYRFDVDSETPTLIAAKVRQRTGVLGASEDAARVYFLSPEALAPGATAGEPNLYLDEEGTKTFIATLAEEDEVGPAPTAETGVTADTSSNGVNRDFSQVSPDGSRLFFHSRAPLTGYDSTSANQGTAAIEIYVYDAEADEIDCVSCNPSGARPRTSALMVPYKFRGEDSPTGAIAAAWLPTPRRGTYTPRMMGEDGSHLFFNAHDALVPEDTNGVQDVYKWTEQGVGGCAEEDGCVSLISTGASAEKAVFIDASGDGQDVFFRTGASIVPQDEGLIDIYDARAGGGFPRPSTPPECAGDACQDVPAAPEFRNAASAGFRGAGNPALARNCTAQARQAAKLNRKAKALHRKAEGAKSPEQAKALQERSARYAKQAKDLGKRATRCRRANRGAAR